MSKNATEAKRIYLFCLFYIEAEYHFTTTMDPMTMKEYTIVDCEAEEIEDLAAELAKTDDVYSYHCKLLELQTALDAYRRKVEDNSMLTFARFIKKCCFIKGNVGENCIFWK